MEPRWYQEEAVHECWQNLRSAPGNPCIVAPTGSGKSWIIAMLVRDAIERWKGRAIILAHRKELLQQNAEKIQSLLPEHKVGVYSAGLKVRESRPDIVVAGIQSVYQRAKEIGERHIAIVDEAHLIPLENNGMYQRFLRELGARTTIGLTATPYRTGSGSIVDDGFLDYITYEVPLRQLMDEGFLCPVSNIPVSGADLSRVQVRGGEFVARQMEDAFLSVIKRTCDELVEATKGRKSILVFGAGVSHAEQIADLIEQATGEEVNLVIGTTPPLMREASLRRFKAGEYRWLVNCAVLTTGFDAPNIDAIAVIRATKSPGLFAQICGRGFRIDPNKDDCLILDFGNNIDRHGPLDSEDYGKDKSGDSEAPEKECLNCHKTCPTGCAFCPHCGAAFLIAEKNDTKRHTEVPDTESDLFIPPAKELNIESIFWHRHQKRNSVPGKPDTLRIDYECKKDDQEGNLGYEVISEWVCIEHEGFARSKAAEWWHEHSITICPDSIEGCIDLRMQGAVRNPIKIVAKKDGRWWRVLRRVFEEDRPDSWDGEDVLDEEYDPFEESPF